MEDYKKRYEEALERARELHDKHPLGEPPTWTICEQIFPELAESEDERIRKSLIRILHVGGYMPPEDKEKAFAWLNKK